MSNILIWFNNNQGLLAVVGIIITIIVPLVGFLFSKERKESKIHSQRINDKGSRNKNIQAGRDINISLPKSGSKEKSDVQSGSKTIKDEPMQMRLEDILWEWHWRKNSARRDNSDILDLKPLCPIHEYELEYKWESDGLGSSWPTALFCRECGSDILSFSDFASVYEFEDVIKREIVAQSRRSITKT